MSRNSILFRPALTLAFFAIAILITSPALAQNNDGFSNGIPVLLVECGSYLECLYYSWVVFFINIVIGPLIALTNLMLIATGAPPESLFGFLGVRPIEADDQQPPDTSGEGEGEAA